MAHAFRRQKHLRTEALGREYQKVTMICHFRRHLPEEDAEAWPAEAPADGGALLRVVERCSKPFRGRFPTNPLSTLAVYPAICCRCGRSISPQPSRQASLVRIPHPVPFHTGSVSRDSLPLRQVHLAVTLPAGISGTDSSSGSFPHWQRFPRFAAVAAGPSRRNPPGRHLWYGFLIRFLSTLAAFPAIRCRCGRSISPQPSRQASLVRIHHPVPFHTGSVSRDSLPLR